MNVSGDNACGNVLDGSGGGGGTCINSDCISPDPICDGGVFICRPDSQGVVRCFCKDSCQGDADCCEGGICVEGKCQTQECTELTEFVDCGSSAYSCKDGRCIPDEEEDPCPQGMNRNRDGECVGKCTTFCDSYKKTHGTRGPGCAEVQECDACNDCSENGICRQIQENAPCWCVCSQDAPYCFDCTNDGSTQLNCADCQTCSELPQWTCACGVVLEEPVKICRNACEGPNRVTQEEMEQEAERQCAERCGIDSVCYGNCNVITYDLSADELPACPQGYICDQVKQFGGTGTTTGGSYYKYQGYLPDGQTTVAGRLKVTAINKNTNQRETIPFSTPDSGYRSANWKGAVVHLTVHIDTRDRMDEACVADYCSNILPPMYAGASTAPIADGFGGFIIPNPGPACTDWEQYRFNAGSGNVGSFHPAVFNRNHSCFVKSESAAIVRVSGYPYKAEQINMAGIGDPVSNATNPRTYWPNPEAVVWLSDYDTSTIQIEHTNTPAANHIEQTFLYDLNGDRTSVKSERRECFVEDLPPECSEINQDKVLMISIIDEDDGQTQTGLETDWACVMSQFPNRKFVLFQPDAEAPHGLRKNGGSALGNGAVKFPASFDADGGIAFAVDRYNDVNTTPWIQLIDNILDLEGIEQVNVWCDTSGSMTIATVQHHLNKLRVDLNQRGIAYGNMNEAQDNAFYGNFGERWAAPHCYLNPTAGFTELQYCGDEGTRVEVVAVPKGVQITQTIGGYDTLLNLIDVQELSGTEGGAGLGGLIYWQIDATATDFNNQGAGVQELTTGLFDSSTYSGPNLISYKPDGAGGWEILDLSLFGGDVCSDIRTLVLYEEGGCPNSCLPLPYDVSPEPTFVNNGQGEQGGQGCNYCVEVRRQSNGSYQVKWIIGGSVAKTESFSAGSWSKTLHQPQQVQNFLDGRTRRNSLWQWQENYSKYLNGLRDNGNTLASLQLQHGGKLWVTGAYFQACMGVRTFDSTIPGNHYAQTYGKADGAPVPAGEHYFDWYSSSTHGPLNRKWMRYGGYGACSSEVERDAFFYGAQARYEIIEVRAEGSGDALDPDNPSPCSSVENIGQVTWDAQCSQPKPQYQSYSVSYG